MSQVHVVPMIKMRGVHIPLSCCLWTAVIHIRSIKSDGNGCSRVWVGKHGNSLKNFSLRSKTLDIHCSKFMQYI